MTKATSTKSADPVTVADMRATLKDLQQPAVVKKLRAAGEAHSKAAGKFFLTVLATYLHAGREDTLSAIRATWADSYDAARQYATNVCRMAHSVEEDGKVARLPAMRTVADLRTLASEIKKASQSTKEVEEAAKGGNEGTNPINPDVGLTGTDSTVPDTRFAVSAMAAVQEALAALSAIADDALAASKNKSLTPAALRHAMEISGTAMYAHITRLGSVVNEKNAAKAHANTVAQRKASKPKAAAAIEALKKASAPRKAKAPKPDVATILAGMVAEQAATSVAPQAEAVPA
jgi:hypothetical protein